MPGSSSPYYPPRSRWYSPVRYPWIHFRQHVSSLWSICDRRMILGWRATLLSFVVPGYVFGTVGYKKIATLAMAACGLAWLIFFLWLGYPVATASFSVILSLHVTSIVFLLNRLNPGQPLPLRMITTLGVLFALNTLIYGTVQRQIERTFMPLRIGKNVVVVRGYGARHLHRGDWIAYRIGHNSANFQGENFHGSIVAQSGFGLEPVMAIPGDKIEFGKTRYRVNGQSFPNKAYMPTSDEITLGEKQWLVWPKFVIRSGGMPDAQISNFLQGYATISEHDIVGRPFKRWFWRKQILP